MAAELTALRTTIVDTIGANDAALAVELLWQFLDLHASTFERADDSSGRISEIFRTACDSVGSLAQSAKLAPEALAAWAMRKTTDNGYSIYDHLIMSLDAALGKHGRAALRRMLLERRDAHLTADKRAAVAAGQFDYTLSGISLALRDIADCEGDVDAFINTYQVRDLTNPKFVSEIASRLVKARRAKEALTYLDRAAPSAANRHFGQTEWTDARISALDALKRHQRRGASSTTVTLRDPAQRATLARLSRPLARFRRCRS